jgi:hypothetical protein
LQTKVPHEHFGYSLGWDRTRPLEHGIRQTHGDWSVTSAKLDVKTNHNS